MFANFLENIFDLAKTLISGLHILYLYLIVVKLIHLQTSEPF